MDKQKNYMLFSERKKLADEYEEWVNKPLEDGSKVKDCALSVITFMVIKGFCKIPEGAVVVPDMADKDFYTIEKTEWDKMVQGAKDIIHEKEEKVAEKFAEKFKEKMKAKYQGTGLWWTEIVLMANEIAKEFTGDKS